MIDIKATRPSWAGKSTPTGFVHIVPEFGAPGVCEDFDGDCFEIPADHPGVPANACWAQCWVIDKSRGQCPFVD